jgi:hypothetical protein
MVKKRKYTTENEHAIDRISRKLDNYWTVGINIRCMLGTSLIVDGVLAIILEYARISCFTALYSGYMEPECVLGVGSTFRDAQKIVIRRMLKTHFDRHYNDDNDSEIDKLRTMVRDMQLQLKTNFNSLDDLSDCEMEMLCESMNDGENDWYRIHETTFFF